MQFFTKEKKSIQFQFSASLKEEEEEEKEQPLALQLGGIEETQIMPIWLPKV